MVKSRAIVLFGLPAAGKSEVGRVLADLLGRRFVDIDKIVAAEMGEAANVDGSGSDARDDSIGADGGHAEVQRRQSEILAAAAADSASSNSASDSGPSTPVIVVRSNVVATEANRRLLSDASQTVWIDAPDEVLSKRLGMAGNTDPDRIRRHRLEHLAYSSVCADHLVDNGGSRSIEEIARHIMALVADTSDPVVSEPVEVSGGRSYPVLVGPGAVALLPTLLPEGVRRVAVVTQAGIGVEVDPGVEHRVFTVEDGEGAKRLDVVGDLASSFARWGLSRRDAVISVGGGVVSDLAGYVASGYHRGVAVIHVSTTLLGQIDAAIGGKCGVNLPEGKNLLGAFKQPAAVICDTSTLLTLPEAELRSGMGELAKYHFLGGGHLDRLAMADRVAACVRIKADVVAADELEDGRRAILNYGHTLAHALESATRYRIRHGEAVAVGLLYAAELAVALGRIDRARADEHRRVIDTYGLDPVMPSGIDGDEIVELFGRDKKAIDGITFVLDGPQGVEPVLVEDRQLLRETLETVTAETTGTGR